MIHLIKTKNIRLWCYSLNLYSQEENVLMNQMFFQYHLAAQINVLKHFKVLILDGFTADFMDSGKCAVEFG